MSTTLPVHTATSDPAAYAIAGATPAAVARPASREQVAEILRDAARNGLSVVPWGAGVALAHEPAPERYDLALDLSGLNRLVEYDPEDFTVTAECGITIAALRAALAARGQELPIEAPHAERATLGGVLAADASGPRRLRFGAPHDRILGARFVLADGTLARSGGKVVKNVAGYAIHRLLCGSHGGLAVFVEASLKLAPASGARVALAYPMNVTELTDSHRWSAFPRLEPAVLTVMDASRLTAPLLDPTDTSHVVVIGFEDDQPRVDEQCAAAAAALGPPAARLEGDQAAALWQTLTDLEDTSTRLSFTTAANTPEGLAPLLAEDSRLEMVFHAPAGRLHLFPPRDQAQPWVNRAAEHGFRLIFARGLDVRPALAPHPGLATLRQRIRSAFDRRGTLATSAKWAAGGF